MKASGNAKVPATLCLCPVPVWEQRMVFQSLVTDGVNRARGVTHQTIGPTLNFARARHASAKPVTLTGLVGGDRGQAIRAELTGLGIAHGFLDMPQPTPACVCVMDESTGHQTRLFDPQPGIDRDDYQRLLQHVKRLLATGQFTQLTLPVELLAEYQAAADAMGIGVITDEGT